MRCPARLPISGVNRSARGSASISGWLRSSGPAEVVAVERARQSQPHPAAAPPRLHVRRRLRQLGVAAGEHELVGGVAIGDHQAPRRRQRVHRRLVEPGDRQQAVRARVAGGVLEQAPLVGEAHRRLEGQRAAEHEGRVLPRGMSQHEVGRRQAPPLPPHPCVVRDGPGDQQRLQQRRAGDRVGARGQSRLPQIDPDLGRRAIERGAGALGQVDDAAGPLGALAGADERGTRWAGGVAVVDVAAVDVAGVDVGAPLAEPGDRACDGMRRGPCAERPASPARGHLCMGRTRLAAP